LRIAVIGGTGLVGRHAVDALGRAGHDAVVVARSRGVDVATGEGLDEALVGAKAVVDVTNPAVWDTDEARATFGAMTERLLAAEERAGVAHHVLLSIVGVDRVEGNAHYAGKRRQEELVEAGSVPFTILPATQFHEFAEVAAGPPQGRARELAGPATEDLVDMARRTLAAWRRGGAAGADLAERRLRRRDGRRGPPARPRGPARADDVRGLARGGAG